MLISTSFIIFHDDPHENFAIMKDTYTYSVLVVEEGVEAKSSGLMARLILVLE